MHVFDVFFDVFLLIIFLMGNQHSSTSSLSIPNRRSTTGNDQHSRHGLKKKRRAVDTKRDLGKGGKNTHLENEGSCMDLP